MSNTQVVPLRRSHSLGRIVSFNFGHAKPKRPKKIFHFGKKESKVGALKRYWNGKTNSGRKTEYDRLEKFHKKSLQEVLAQPYSDKAMFVCLKNMLSSTEHPYGMVVVQFGREILSTFEGGDLAQAFADIKSRLEAFATSMAGTLFLQYENILGQSTMNDFNYLCQDAMYDALLSREPNMILDYYHMKFSAQDHTLCTLGDKVVSQLTPAHLGVQRKFWLIPKIGRVGEQPYHTAITTFQQFPLFRSPMEKVKVLRDTAKTICSSVEQFWDINRGDFPKGEDMAISADDLVAIFSYVILKSQVGLLYSEGEYICDFVSDMNLMGETGYLITTFQCCCISLINTEAQELLQSPTRASQ